MTSCRIPDIEKRGSQVRRTRPPLSTSLALHALKTIIERTGMTIDRFFSGIRTAVIYDGHISLGFHLEETEQQCVGKRIGIWHLKRMEIGFGSAGEEDDDRQISRRLSILMRVYQSWCAKHGAGVFRHFKFRLTIDD